MVWDVERMDEYRMPRRVLMEEESGGRIGGRPRSGWMDGVKMAGQDELRWRLRERVESPGTYFVTE